MRIGASQPASTRLSVTHVPSLAKIMDCTKEQIRDSFERFGGLLM